MFIFIFLACKCSVPELSESLTFYKTEYIMSMPAIQNVLPILP
jgi:hypothetical protein